MTRPSVKRRLSLVPTWRREHFFFFFFPFPSASVTQTKGKAAAAAATTSFIMRGRYSWRRMTTTWLLIAPPPSRIHSVTSRNGIDSSISTRPALTQLLWQSHRDGKRHVEYCCLEHKDGRRKLDPI